jgi:hypothetical protein
MIAPAASNFEVAWGVALFGKPVRLDQRDRGCIARLDIGLQAVELEFAEGVAYGSAQPFVHETPPLKTSECVETEIAAAEHAQHNVCNVDDPNNAVAFALAHEKRTVFRPRHTLDEASKLIGRGCCAYPKVVKRTTGLHRREELALVCVGGLAETDASDHCNLTFW